MIIEIPYKPRPLQAEIHAALKRWSVLVCHRRFGKSVLSVNHLIKSMAQCREHNPRFAYLAPLYKQVKSIAWDYLKHYARPIPGVTFNESELRADFPGGGRISLYGADNPDALRGIYLDGVVLDEYAQINPRVFPEIIRPTLVDRHGWALFIGTPFGRNHFYELFETAKNNSDWFSATYKASQTGIVSPEELLAAKELMSDEQYAQEFECAFDSAIVGAYYGKQMAKALEEGRICNVAHEPNLPVFTLWDLGIGDAMAIWFVQRVGREVHFIDYYETSGEGMAYYAKLLQSKPYVYERHYMPHDANAKEIGTGKSRRDTAENLGIKPIDVVPRGDVDDGIEAGRNMLSKCWFDENKCSQGINALRSYRKEYDENRQEFKNKPYHDWASHGADAYRTGAASDFLTVSLANQYKPVKVVTDYRVLSR
jgi:phage terminase large subunit